MIPLKFLSFIFIIVYVGALKLTPQEFHVKRLNGTDAYCKKEFNLTNYDIKAGLESADTPRNIKCFFRCFYEKSKLIQNGAFDRNFSIQLMSELVSFEDANAIYKTCVSVPDGDLCEYSYTAFSCFLKEVKKYGVFYDCVFYPEGCSATVVV